MEHQEGGLGQVSSFLDEWWVTYEPPGTFTNREGPQGSPSEGSRRSLFLSALRAAATAPTDGSTTRTSGSTTTESTCTESCTNDTPNPTNLRLLRMWCLALDKCLSGPEASGWSGAPLLTTQTPLGQLWRNVKRLPVLPRPDPPPTHTHTERRRGSSACSPREAPAPNFLLAHATQQKLRQHRVEAVRGARGNLTWRTTFHSQELSRRGKKGATQLQGRTA
ncbi:hypothetical protein GWK47_053113 [Chionoecetes opilio]|uniref:Uncharacterized protein n=1 Tax=Chionoecetes opilio TaxID=41210 RepID=A0A8J5C9B7_CHIOP|nr:hypothetical protein GWK47_053113 [Chionoecetes opilio]